MVRSHQSQMPVTTPEALKTSSFSGLQQVQSHSQPHHMTARDCPNSTPFLMNAVHPRAAFYCVGMTTESGF
jgi:hypothetical protein